MKAVRRPLTVVGILLLLLGTIAGVIHREALDADRFADHVDAVRADPAVARQLGALVTARVLAAQPDLTAVRPLIESAATTLVASPALGSTVRSAAVGPLYRTMTDGGHDTVVLRLADLAALAIGVVNVAAPEQRAVLPSGLDVRLSDFGGRDTSAEILEWVHLVGWMSWAFPLLALLVLAGAGAGFGADDRARRARLSGALATIGRGAVGAAAGLAALLVLVGFLVGRLDDESLSGAVLQAVWRELGGEFWAPAGVLAASGYVLTLLARPGPVRRARDLGPQALVSHAWSQLLDPGPRLGPRTSRAGFVGLAGLALVLQPLQLLRALLWAVGVVLVLTGLALLVPIVVAAVREQVLRRTRNPQPSARSQHVAIAGSLIAVVLVLGVGALPAHDDAAEAFGHEDTTCNGSVALCSRPYDEVAFPATHNSMAAADEPGWFFAEQPDGIVAQLNHGIRVLLIDSWYGQRTQRAGIIANTDDSRAAALAEARESFGPDALRSALRLRDALNLTPRGPIEPYLCHALCELGSTKWLPVMEHVRGWLATHPRTVVTLFVQDTVSPADTAEVIRQAGLLPYVYTPGVDRTWPTLGQMIDSGQRLVVLMQRHGGGTTYPWLLPAFHWVQDTPFSFRRPQDFSCRPNRGVPGASLFLLNHWLTDKQREVTNAARVNARAVLLTRARQCQAERGLLPNFVAVDFYNQGDLFDVVRTLNGTR